MYFAWTEDTLDVQVDLLILSLMQLRCTPCILHFFELSLQCSLLGFTNMKIDFPGDKEN
jgi:hypothetical protein